MRLLLLVIAISLISCDAEDASDAMESQAREGPTSIRLINRSEAPLENVVVGFPSTMEDYGSIAPRQATSYRTVHRAYRYAYVKATVDGKPAIIQPIDYVGEDFLGPGYFAFALQYNQGAKSEYDRLSLQLVHE